MKDRRWVVQKEKKKKDGLVKTSASSSSNEVSVTHGFLSGREDSCLGSHAWEVADLYSWHYLNRNQISGVITSFIYPFLLRLIPVSLPLHPSMSDVFWPSLTLFSLLLLERWRTSFLTPTLKLLKHWNPKHCNGLFCDFLSRKSNVWWEFLCNPSHTPLLQRQLMTQWGCNTSSLPGPAWQGSF